MLPPILNFLNREHYQIYYTPIARLFKSIEAAILLSEFVQRYQYHQERGELQEFPGLGAGWFYHSQAVIEKRTTIGDRQFRNAIKLLKEHNILESVRCGMPYRKYYRINMAGIDQLGMKLSNKQSTLSATHEQDEMQDPVKEELQQISNKHSTPYATDEHVGSTCTNTSVRVVPTVPLYIKEPKKDPISKRDIRTGAPACATDTALLFLFGKYVKMPMTDYEALVKKHGQKEVDAQVDDLEDYIPNKPGKPYKDHAAVVRSWIKKERKTGPREDDDEGVGLADRIVQNRMVAEAIQEKLKNQFAARVYFSAHQEMCILVNSNKDISKKYFYDRLEPRLFLMTVVRDLENNFRDVRKLLKG